MAEIDLDAVPLTITQGRKDRQVIPWATQAADQGGSTWDSQPFSATFKSMSLLQPMLSMHLMDLSLKTQTVGTKMAAQSFQTHVMKNACGIHTVYIMVQDD